MEAWGGMEQHRAGRSTWGSTLCHVVECGNSERRGGAQCGTNVYSGAWMAQGARSNME